MTTLMMQENMISLTLMGHKDDIQMLKLSNQQIKNVNISKFKNQQTCALGKTFFKERASS